MIQNKTLISDVVNYCNDIFHPELQEDYDNSGFLLGDRNRQCTGVLVAVDVTPHVVQEAIDNNLNLIITHHPFIFGGLKRITTDSLSGQIIYTLIQNNIALYAAHTNLDNLKDGVNGILAEKLNINDVSILRPLKDVHDAGSGMIGDLAESTDTDRFLSQVKQTLAIPMVRTSQLVHKQVRRIAICGGAGSFLIADAIAAKADVFLTSDLKYHDFQSAEGRIILVDVGHYESEQFAKEIIYRAISQKFITFACRFSDSSNSFISYF